MLVRETQHQLLGYSMSSDLQMIKDGRGGWLHWPNFFDFFDFFFSDFMVRKDAFSCQVSLRNFITSVQKCNSRDQSVCGFPAVMQSRGSHATGAAEIIQIPKGSLLVATNNSRPPSGRKVSTDSKDQACPPYVGLVSSACAKGGCFALTALRLSEKWWQT